MTITEIVKFKNLIDSMGVDPQAADVIRHFEGLANYVSNSEIQ